jgi:hypothetical protein
VEVRLESGDEHQKKNADFRQVTDDRVESGSRVTGRRLDCGKDWPSKNVQDGRAEDQPDENLAEDGRLADPACETAGELCRRDRQREQEQELKKMGHQEALNRRASM